MTTLNEQIVKHLNEYADLLKKQNQETAKLRMQQAAEVAQQGSSPKLAYTHRTQLTDLGYKHESERNRLVRTHDQEYEFLRKNKELLNNAKASLAFADQLEEKFKQEQKEKLPKT